MTPEMRKELAGYLPFSQNATIDIIPEIYLKKRAIWNKEKGEFVDTDEDVVPAEFRPTFTVRCFNRAEHDKAKKLLLEYRNEKTTDERKSQIEDESRGLVRMVVKGLTNLIDIGSGETIEYKADPDGGCDKGIFERLFDGTISNLLEFVNRISGLLPGERLSLK
jgi:hypothetical protein